MVPSANTEYAKSQYAQELFDVFRPKPHFMSTLGIQLSLVHIQKPAPYQFVIPLIFFPNVVQV